MRRAFSILLVFTFFFAFQVSSAPNVFASAVTASRANDADDLVNGAAFDNLGPWVLTVADDANFTTGVVTTAGNGGLNAGTLTFAGSSVLNTVAFSDPAAGTVANALLTINAGLAGESVRFNGDVFATTVNITGAGVVSSESITGAVVFLGNGILGVNDDENITGSITTNGVDNQGTLSLGGGTQTVFGQIGTSAVADLNVINVGEDACCVDTFTGAVFANTVNITGNAPQINFQASLTGNLNFIALANGEVRFSDNADITGTVTNTTNGLGRLTFLGTSAVSGQIGTGAVALSTVRAGAAGEMVTFNGDIFAAEVDVTGTGTVNADSIIGSIVFEANGVLSIDDNEDITGTITNTSGAAAGTVTAEGTTIFSDQLGAAGVAALSAVTAGAAGEIVTFDGDVFAAAFMVTSIGTVNADSITGSVVFLGDGTLSIDTGEDITGAITNTTGAAAGTLTLEGTNTVTGAIGSAGTGALSVINAGATGGVVTLGGDAFATTFNVTGTGTVNAGSITGSVVFLGDGTLSIDPNEAITGAVTNGTDGFGTLTFEGTTATGGAIGVAGTGDLLAVNFNGGIATLNNNIAAITTTVNADTDLMLSADRMITGNLTLAVTSDLELADNTLTLAGTGIYTQGAGTSLNLAINSAADFGSVQAAGNSAIAGGSLVDVNVLGPVASGATFNVVNGGAAGAVGAVTVTDNSTFLSFTGAGSAGDLILTAALNTSGVATTPNSLAVLMAIDGALASGTASADFLNVINQLYGITDTAAATAALEQLDPIVNGGILGASYAIGGQFMHTLISHLDALHSGYLLPPGTQTSQTTKTMQTGVASGDALGHENWWAQGFGTTIEQDARDGISGYEADVWGTAIGADRMIGERFRWGWAGGYASGDVSANEDDGFIGDDNGQTDIDSYQGALYTAYSGGPWYLNGAFVFAWNDYDGTREISFAGINRTATSDYSGQQYNGLIDGGYTFKNGPWDITPLASLNYIHLDIEDYTEEGANSLNLIVSDQDYDVLQSGLGIKLAYPLLWDAGTFVPEVHAKWLYDFIGDEMQTSAAFFGGGPSFSTNGLEPAQHSLNAGGSLVFYSKGNISVSANYEFDWKDDYTAHSGYGTVKVHF